MPGPSNYPAGFDTGLTLRNIPVTSAYPGQIFYVYSGSALLPGQRGGSNGNKGTFNSPFATIAYAQTQCVAGRGDVIFVKPGHTETVISATTLVMDKSGVAVIGLGTGSLRPTVTFTTANTAAIPVSAASCAFKNMIFVANFLGIARCFTVTATDFAVEDCLFTDTSSILNFLNIINCTGGANTADGLTFNNNQVANLGVTSNNTTILSANTIDRLTMQRNKLRWAVQNNVAIGVIMTAGILTNADIGDNLGYRPNTTTAGGSFITVTGTTSTGWVYRNYIQTLTTTADLLFTTTVGLAAFENRVTGAVGATGFVIPAVDS
tara:strand:- start:1054 stop:2016 length:963 start_codon:yes stop_codon:yes gene_type:complete